MKKILIVLVVAAAVLGVGYYLGSNRSPESPVDTDEDIKTPPAQEEPYVDHKDDLIYIETPKPRDAISSPLTIEGRARGYWFFEASFPIILTDWDGKIIAESYATADGEWMTEDYVDFTATLEFEKPEFGEKGFLILKKDNPSGLPENDNALEIEVYFK